MERSAIRERCASSIAVPDYAAFHPGDVLHCGQRRSTKPRHAAGRATARLPEAAHACARSPPGAPQRLSYGFIANIYFFDIETPLKQFVVAHGNIARHCRAIHDAVMAKPT